MAIKTHKILIVGLIALMYCAIACSDANEAGRFESVGAGGWTYDDTICFVPDSAMIDSARCNVAVAVRHTNGYEYANIWLEITTVQADSVHRDTFDIRLADEIGHWYGTGLGVGYQKVDTLLRGAALDLDQPILVRHIMRVDTLSGIEQLGIIITSD